MNAVVEHRGELQTLPPGPGPSGQLPAITPMEMLQVAVQQGADLDKLQKLMDLRDRWEAKEAEKAFVAAITQFKQHPPEILKRKRVYYKNKSGGVTDYMHAELSDVCAAAIKGLADVGITHRWDIVEQTPTLITVACVLTHAQGHSQRTVMSGPPDPSGGKNELQAIASGVAYLERYTLLAATGLAAKGMDNDGRGAGDAPQFITAEQVADLNALITEVGADRAAFLKYCKVERLEELPVAKYTPAVRALEAKRG